MGIRAKILVPFFLAFLLIAMVIQFYWGPRLLDEERNKIIQHSHQMFQLLAVNLVQPLLANDLGYIYNLLNNIHQNDQNWEGIVLSNSDGVRLYPLAIDKEFSGPNLISLAFPIDYNDETIANLVVIVDIDRELQQAYGHIQLLELYALVISVLVALMVVSWFNITIRRPLIDLEKATYRISKGDFDIELDDATKAADEIGSLARSFSRMNQNLEIANSTLLATANESFEREERQKAIVQNIADGIVILDSHFFLSSYNPAAKQILSQLFTPINDEDFSRFIDKVIDTQDLHANVVTTYNDISVKTLQGELLDLEMVITSTSFSDEKLYILIIRDITEQKHLDRMKNEFVSTVSHELRTPLTSIQGSLGLVLGGVTGELQPEQHRIVSIAKKNSDRLLLLVNDILDMQKIESGEIDFTMEKMNLVEALKKGIEDNAGYAAKHQVKYQFISDPESHYTVYCDANRLSQIINNLLSNAAKFSHVNGEIHIGVNEIDGDVQFFVQDYGQGMPESFIPRLFEKFSQVDSSDSKKNYGTGLGMPITKALVEKQQGTISVKSKLGEGTTFFVSLPLYHEF